MLRFFNLIFCIVIFSNLFGIVYNKQGVLGGRRRFGSVGEPSVIPVDTSGIENKWIVQKVDNFNPNNNATWYNRYFDNNAFYKKGGPIFLMFRGEDSASKGFMVAGAWIRYAQKYNAMLFQLEQRFYGISTPTKNLNVSNLAYLTSEQAIADAANFIQEMNRRHRYTPDQKWIMFGGSYAGSLAMWTVEKYPKLAYGSISSSSPVHDILNFKEYLDAVTNGLATYSPKCPLAVKHAFSDLTKALKTTQGQISLQSQLSLCGSAVNATALDVSNLLYGVTGDFMDAVQYNGINSNIAFVGIDLVCKTMLNETIGTLLSRLGQVNQLFLIEQKDPCMSFKYNKFIKHMRETYINSADSYGNRQWIFQTCNEFGYFQTTEGETEVFGKDFPLPFFVKQCEEIFGPKYNLNYTSEKVDGTNRIFGGLHPNVNNVLSIQGSLDPWHSRGITKNFTTTGGVRAIFINGTAHCADIYSPSPNDPPQLTEARNEISYYIGEILKAASSSSSSSS